MTADPIPVGDVPVEAPVGLWRVPRSTEPVYRVIGLLPGDVGMPTVESVVLRVSSPHEAFDAAFTYCERAGRAYVVRDEAGDLVENPTTRCTVREALGANVRCGQVSVGFDYDPIDGEPIPVCTDHAQQFYVGLRLNDQEDR